MISPPPTVPPQLPEAPLRGYIEGYYGRLLTWQDRDRIVARMATLGLNTYLYAPKEDSCHRVDWRAPWPDDWLGSFAAMCRVAAARGVMVFAGIAPGLDYDPAHDNVEFDILLSKAHALQDAGAAAIVLMFDDIEPPSSTLDTALSQEIALHAGIATRLAACLDVPTLIVPRIYADEISDAAADSYQVLSLRATTIDFMVSNFGAVVQSEAFKDLVKLESRGLVLRFLEEASVRLQPRED